MEERRENWKRLGIGLTPEEHKAFKMRSVEYEVSIVDAVRFALADPETWRRAAEAKRAEKAGGKPAAAALDEIGAEVKPPKKRGAKRGKAS